MRIFSGIPSGDSYETIKAAAVAIERKAQEQALTSSAWSLAELQPDNDDFRWLCDWAGQLHSGVAYRCLIEQPLRKFNNADRIFSYSTATGILLLMSAVEIARREASEGSLWSILQHGYFSDTTKQVLFTQGHPTHAYKSAIELTARRFKLRHVFGVEGMQNWFDTVYLQFGFTRRGFLRRLPEWLVGQEQTLAIQQLLSDSMRSSTFEKLWQTLLDYRRKILTERQFCERISGNPWILPEWTGDLTRQALARPYLRIDEGASAKSANTEAITEQFLDAPRLHWDPPNPPQFTCRVVNLANLDLTERSYTIVIGEYSCGQLRKRADGAYCVEPTDEIALPTVSPSLVANLIDPDGQVIHSQTLQLWDENEDVMAFNASSSHRFDPWKNVMHTESAYILLLAPDLTIAPQPKYFYKWYVQERPLANLFFLPHDWSAQTSVLLQGEILWQPHFIQPSFGSEQAIKDAIYIHIYEGAQKLFFGERIRLSIAHPKDVQLVSIRSGGKSIEFVRQDDERVITDPITVIPNLFAREGNNALEMAIAMRGQRGSVRIRKTVEFPITGAALLTPDGWAVLDGQATLTVELAQMTVVKFFLIEIEKWILLESNIGVSRLWKRPHSIGTLAGFGSPLIMQEGSAYNAQYHEAFSLAREVVDHGIIAEVEIDTSDKANRTLSIRLSHSIEPDEDHNIVWWDQSGSFHTFAIECDITQISAMWWLSTIPPALTQPLVIAIAYKGKRLGTWWSKDWSRALQALPVQDPLTVAAMLRWFKLPLLSSHVRDNVQQFAFIYSDAVLEAWIEEVSLPSSLYHVGISDEWLAVVRTIFQRWQPDTEAVRKIVTRLKSDDAEIPPQEMLLHVVAKLLKVSPLLMGCVVLHWVNTVSVPEWGVSNTQVLVRAAKFGITETSNSEEYGKRRKQWENEMVKLMSENTTSSVDSAFVKMLIQRALEVLQGHPLSMTDEQNIAVTLHNIKPFQQFLALRLLEKIDQMMTDRR